MPSKPIQKLVISLVWCGLSLGCSNSDPAPIPSIISFSPQAGPVSTQVIISGVNFSAEAAQNDVRFNGVKATVTASTGNQITATVPAKATSGVITIGVNGQSCVSNSPFTINPLVGTWRFTSATFTNCADPSDDGVSVCTVDCPILAITESTMVYTDGPSSYSFTYTLSATTLTISSPGGSFSPTYVLVGNQLTLVYPPDTCSVTENYDKL